MHKIFGGILFATIGSLVAATQGACSSNDLASEAGTLSGCQGDSAKCAANQTCWVKGDNLDRDCEPSGPGKLGDVCQVVVGMPTCGAGMVCLAPDSTMTYAVSGAGTCLTLCQDNNTAAPTCAAGLTCTRTTANKSGPLGAPIYYVCTGTASTTDAGADGSVVDASAGDGS